jgi:hypothetical protein
LPQQLRRALALTLALGACGDDDGGPAPTIDASASSLDAHQPPAGQVVAVTLPGCGTLAPGVEDCHFRLQWDPAHCGGGACERLLVYWSGGEQACADGSYDPLMARYVEAGFVAACAQPFTTGDEAGQYPFTAEFPRMDLLTARIRAEAGAAWDGTHLLIAGVSHGGTAPVVAIASARAFHDHAAVWTGSTHTAVILFDGISNPATLEQFVGGETGCGLFHGRFVGRYGDGAPLAHGCANGACYCSTPAHAADWAGDTTVIGATAPPSPYTCDDFTGDGQTILYRYVSCGGEGAPVCNLAGGDLIPDDQQLLPQQALAVCPGVTTSYQDFPACAHTMCSTWDSCGGADGVAWLEANGW